MVRIQTKEQVTPAWGETETESTEDVRNTAGTGRTPQCQGQLRVFMAAQTVNPLCILLNTFSHEKSISFEHQETQLLLLKVMDKDQVPRVQ